MRGLLVGAVLVLAACSDDDDATSTSSTAVTTTAADVPTTTVPATPAAATTAAATSAPPATTPASVIVDTAAVGGSTLSTVDLTTGAATLLGAVGTEVGVLGIAAEPGGTIFAVTDQPSLLAIDPAALDSPGDATPIDAGGATLLALARRPDGALFAVADTGAVVRVDAATGSTVTVAEIAVDDPGVGLDVTADGRLEVVVATGARRVVDVGSGKVLDLPSLTAGGSPARIVALAHDARRRYGIDADRDELVAIADDGSVTPIGPLGLDVTDGASLDIGPDGTAVLANPG